MNFKLMCDLIYALPHKYIFIKFNHEQHYKIYFLSVIKARLITCGLATTENVLNTSKSTKTFI